MYPVINRIKCEGCSYCIDVCNYEMFEMYHGKAKVNYKHICHGCMNCVNECSVHAIRMEGDNYEEQN